MHLILGTAGHIDHGKSTLVKHLTGSDPDRLPEEKARGVTIDLGFAHLSLTDSEDTHEVGIVDVPGHADFVNNMVAGVGALDVAMFIVAADDGWMPQSEEHLHILHYLGISHVLIALTKADLCDDVPFAVELLRDELSGTPLEDAPILPVSAHTGDGIEELRTTLADLIRQLPKRPENSNKPRLAIDRLFSPKGTGTVVTGTLSGGPIHLGDTLTLHPLGLETKVRYIQNHNQSLETALPGMRTALNLPDLPLAAPGKPGAERGHILASPNIGQPTRTIDVQLSRLARPVPGHKPRPLRHTETVILHHGSARCHARVILHDRNTLQPGESCLAQLRLENPHLFLTADRFVIRDGGQQITLAGGIVLDPLAQRQGFRTDARAEFLSQRAETPADPHTDALSRLQRDHHIPTSLRNVPYPDVLFQQAIQSLVSDGKAIDTGDLILDAPWWQSLTESAATTIKHWHRDHPDIPAMPLEDLRRDLPACPEHLFEKLTDNLENSGFQRQGNGIASSGHTLSLPDDIATQAKTILSTLQQSGLNPPNKSELASDAKHQQALRFLIRSGQLIELDPKVVISQESAQHAAELVKNYLTQHGQATASDLRQALDTSRKVAMPLLEYLDTTGLTRREENVRVLR